MADEGAWWEKKTGVHVDLQPINWSEALRRVADGEADVIDTIFLDARRARTHRLHRAVRGRALSRSTAESSVKGLVDGIAAPLRGFHVAALAGDTCASTGCAPAA